MTKSIDALGMTACKDKSRWVPFYMDIPDKDVLGAITEYEPQLSKSLIQILLVTA